MVQGGATGTDHSDQLIENVVNYVRGKLDLVSKFENLLKDNDDFKKIDKEFEKLTIEDVTELLRNNKSLLDTVVGYFTENGKDLEVLLEQASKVRGMEENLKALGNRLLIQGVIGGAAITTLTGVAVGSLAIGGIALAGFLALVAIAAIGYTVYKHRSEIKENVNKDMGEVKEGAATLGKAIKSLFKDFIDKLPTIQARENNFSRLKANVLVSIAKVNSQEVQTGGEAKIETKKELVNREKIIDMLQNKEQLAAIKELIKAGTIQSFSEEDMRKLVEKGTSTYVEDMEKLRNFMDQFQPAIMAIGSDIKEVEQKVNEKVQPKSQVGDLSSEQAIDKGKETTRL